MRDFFSYDGPVMTFLSKVADLMLLNVLTLICCLPIVTIGASLTAAHYTALKLCRHEGYIRKNFWKSFKENFKQSTIVWIILLIYIVIAVLSLAILSSANTDEAMVMQGAIFAALILSVLFILWFFPVQSKFVNKVSRNVKLAFILTFRHIFRTIYMLILSVLPLLFAYFTGHAGVGIWLLLGLSVPIYLCALAYNKVFAQLEEKVLKLLI